MKPHGDPLLGRVLGGRYRIERRLGAGGMGTVYAATHLELARPVAVKTLLDVADPRDAERFRKEALAAASLAHPNIVQVSDFVPARGDEPACLVMELLAGRPLTKVIAERGALPVAVALHVARQLLDALAAAHAAHIVHRDIKPANVVVLDGPDADAPWIKVVDFGIAKLMNDGSRHTTTGTVLGTPAYMAPEQHLALPPTPAVDVWAAGVCLFEMLSGRRAFAGPIGDVFAAVMNGPPRDLAKTAPHVPPAIVDVVARAMRRDPNERFADAAAMRDALVAATASPVALPVKLPVKEKKRWPLFLIAMASTLAVALLAGVGMMLLTRERPRVAATADADAAIVPVAIVSAEPTATSDATADPAPDASAAPIARAAPRGVPCICTDGWIALCAEPALACECRGDIAQICLVAWPDGGCWGNDKEIQSKTDRSGEPCTGWKNVTRNHQDVAEPASGKLVCSATCGTSVARRHPTTAVPGTPCSGFTGAERRAGEWVRLVP